jgi:hypothetical protein
MSASRVRPFNELKGEEMNPSCLFDRMNGDVLGMIQGSDRACLALEPLTAVAVRRQLSR